MPFSFSDLFNHDNNNPQAGPFNVNNSIITPHIMDATDPQSNFFAPELFHNQDDAPLTEDPLLHVSQDLGMTIDEEAAMYHNELMNGTGVLDNEHHVKQEEFESAYPPLDVPMPVVAGDTSFEEVSTHDGPHVDRSSTRDSTRGSPESTRQRPKGSGRSRKPDPDGAPKSSVHSSKNEGQHTDRRFLCYLCNKLFTRRRSVRDHISKIHNTKTWEPLRSLEVIVDPVTGEPVEPLEDILARGPPPPPPKMTKAEKAQKAAKREQDDEATARDQEEEHHGQDHHDEEPNHETPQVAAPIPEEPAPAPATQSLKRESSMTGSRASSTEPFATPLPVAGRKRPAPEDSGGLSSAAARKKGTAKVKSSTVPHKRSKLGESEQSASAGSRSLYRSPSATPALPTHVKPIPSKLKNQTSAASVKSPTPASSRAGSLEAETASSSVADTPTSSNDDGEVFCICRKGDNHTWMIACDGGCDEWFHGNCVNIRERDGELIDKYICPTCTKPGLQTTWKRMCRRKDCRKPARVTRDPPSKYCSDECGRMFFVELVQRGDPRAQASKCGQYIVEPEKKKKLRKKTKKKLMSSLEKPSNKPLKSISDLVNGDQMSTDSRLATPAYSENDETEYETDSSLDDDSLPNRGGALRAGEVKGLLEQCKSVEEWRALGRRPNTPPRETEAETTTSDSKPAIQPPPPPSPPPLEMDDLEAAKLASIEEEKRKLQERNTMLSARETLLGLVKARSATITEEVRKANPKMKDVCGFDPRMAWTDEEFRVWYTQQGGKEILDAGPAAARIGPPPDTTNDDENDATARPNGVVVVNGAAADDNPDKKNDGNDETSEADTMPRKGGVCIKNRCSRHRNWAKGQLAELRFEQDLVRRALAKCEAQENRIKERAMVRGWEMRGQTQARAQVEAGSAC
ncbi:COMPASS (complex proteins associated with Set1p) component [Exophiala dermatitidis]|nr:COMPASS (complex proteins associated with Set1p) component [Exophiala dermatitidis]KAJ4671173.1 COMPASS (complex proteins associated with Set1p) component [Exophiala dermatitidis]KAJ4691285.1 COMPASS (complex proteins associated with Set1p) component [Exophiala dermatitidis]